MMHLQVEVIGWMENLGLRLGRELAIFYGNTHKVSARILTNEIGYEVKENRRNAVNPKNNPTHDRPSLRPAVKEGYDPQRLAAPRHDCESVNLVMSSCYDS